MNKEVGGKSSSLLRDEDFCDLTVDTTPSSSDGNSRIKLYREEPQQQQQTVAAAIEPNPINQLTSTTPTMITRSTKEQKEEEEDVLNIHDNRKH